MGPLEGLRILAVEVYGAGPFGSCFRGVDFAAELSATRERFVFAARQF